MGSLITDVYHAEITRHAWEKTLFSFKQYLH